MTGEAKVVRIADVQARRRIADHFYALQAFEPGSAIEFLPLSPDERRQFDQLRADGVIRQQAPGHYWFDLDIHESRARHRRRILPMLAAGLLVLAWAMALYYRS